jgi:cell division septation protein DedD
MNLAVYISELLKTNDCVIIPDLGGFIANYQSSSSNEQGDQFSPPTKEVIFSSKLKKNDGLLVNFISERESVGYLEARKIVAEFVSESIFKLENGEHLDFEQVGSLHYDSNEHLLFEPDPKLLLRTDVYGLDSFHFPQLVNKFNQPPKPVFRDKEPEPQVHRRPVMKYLVLGIPILALLYFLPYNKLLNNKLFNKQSSPNTASMVFSDSPAPKNSEVAATPTQSQTSVSSDTQAASPEKTVEAVESNGSVTTNESAVVSSVPPNVAKPEKRTDVSTSNEPTKGKFHIVGGCFKIRENADKLVEKLIQKGYHAEVSNLRNDFYRVSVESFQTRKEAEDELGKLLNAEPDNGYWLMEDRK